MEELIKHYCELLIIQYKNKPKARATIEALVKILFSDENNNILLNKLQNSYDIETAQLKQLEVLAKYIGYSNTLNIINQNYFRLSDTEGTDETPGLSDLETQEVGFPLLTYSGYTYTETTVSGIAGIEFFRKTLMFLSEMKNKELSLGNLDDILYKYFQNNIVVVEGNKTITYKYNDSVLGAFNFDHSIVETYIKKYMPRPMGCGLYSQYDSDIYFAFTIDTTESLTYTIQYNSQVGYFGKILVDWGDGTTEYYNSNNIFPTHVYSNHQQYQIKITAFNNATLPAIVFGNVYRPDVHSNALISIDYNKCSFQHGLNRKVTHFDNFCCNCENLVSITPDVFKYNAGNVISLKKTFYNCDLTNIPEELFKYNINAINFNETFAYNSNLEEIPNGLFSYLGFKENPTFQKTFFDDNGTNKCKINPDIFCNDLTDKTIRFKDVNPDFYMMFVRKGSYSGTKGVAPELWNYTYKSAPNGRNCFLGQSNDSLENYSNIPSDWGGD